MIQTTSHGSHTTPGLLEPGVTEHHSLALKLLLGNLREDARLRVLDLGPALGANVSFLTGYQCKLFIADLFQTLRTRREGLPWDAEVLDEALAEHLPYRDEGRFDLIFAWDLVNYLDRAELRVLGNHLRQLCQPSGVLFAMVSTLKQIPDRPLQFSILDLETLAYQNRSRVGRPAPGYKEPDLARLLPAFEVETSFLLRHGVQEYLLVPRSA